jgi:hypothetical protein
MRKYLLFLLLLLGFYVGSAVRTTQAAETRGLRVVAKDQITNQIGELVRKRQYGMLERPGPFETKHRIR